MDKAFHVYLLASKRNGTLYIGVTSALVQRVRQHKSKAVEGFTSRYGVDRLVYFEAHGDAPQDEVGAARKQYYNQDRDKEDAQQRETVRKVHS